MSAFDAEHMCLNYGDGLAIVRTAQQKQKLLEFINSTTTRNKIIVLTSIHLKNKCALSLLLEHSQYWIGASDVGKTAGNFYWWDGTKFNDSLWEQDNPNQFREGQKTCVNIYTRDGMFYDFACAANNSFRSVCHLGSNHEKTLMFSN